MLTRRVVLQLGAVAAIAGTLPAGRAFAQPVPLRRSLHQMDLDDPVLASLREFVAQMKEPARNGQPVSWVGFANIHGSGGAFNLCPHGNWYFLPWHRGYLHMYEQAVRNLTGNAEFAMPYWDWSAHPDFPAAFGDETFDGQPNPLFVAGRSMMTGDTVPTGVSGPAVLADIMSQPTFEEFGSTRARGQNSTDPSWIRNSGVQGELESNPHNIIHCTIRGPFMCAATSPQDPIFQMHHCNIDRIWDAWNRQGGSNSADPLWRDMAFQDNFIAPDGSSYGWSVTDLLQVGPLGYTYVAEPPAPEPEPLPDPGRDLYLQYLVGGTGMAESPLAAMQSTATANDVTASPDKPGIATLETAGLNLRALNLESLGAAREEAGLPATKAKLFLRNLKPEMPDHTVLRVFVNTPDANAETPTDDNPNYVTSIGFFGRGPGGVMLMEGMQHDGDMPMEGPSVAVDLPSGAVADGAETITLQLVPVSLGPDADAGPVVVTQLELAIL